MIVERPPDAQGVPRFVDYRMHYICAAAVGRVVPVARTAPLGSRLPQQYRPFGDARKPADQPRACAEKNLVPRIRPPTGRGGVPGTKCPFHVVVVSKDHHIVAGWERANWRPALKRRRGRLWRLWRRSRRRQWYGQWYGRWGKFVLRCFDQATAAAVLLDSLLPLLYRGFDIISVYVDAGRYRSAAYSEAEHRASLVLMVTIERGRRYQRRL